nr:PREDICTED: lamina-associated polypeptide 2, isoforms beta/gamma isoform X3 [Anolis carolinensis]|eukprot:XP_016846693.1 PREDICTED: lamina-associated polypeptide 2, isoforms beta/gamma isoform X3 [Anolis carolinensis]
MDKNYGCLTDDDFFARLKQYGLPHGPIVGTTRKLYEKKLYEYERRLGQQQPLSGSPTICTTSTRKLYEKKIQEYENKLKQQGFGVGAPTARLCQRNSSVKDIYPMSTHISTYTYSSPIETITSEAYRNSGTTENHSSQQTEAWTEEHNRSFSVLTPQIFPNRPIVKEMPVKSSDISGVQRKASEPGSIVDKSKLQMTNDEIFALLKKYGLKHGPVVASTRKLYEKKIQEYENKLKQQGFAVGAPTVEPSEKKMAKSRRNSSVI